MRQSLPTDKDLELSYSAAFSQRHAQRTYFAPLTTQLETYLTRNKGMSMPETRPTPISHSTSHTNRTTSLNLLNYASNVVCRPLELSIVILV